LVGGKTLQGDGHFVEPTIVAIEHDAEIIQVRSCVHSNCGVHLDC
jgi:hypothetical protein